MKVRVPQSEIGKYDPGSFDTRAGEPLSCEQMNGLAQAMLDLAERIKATGLTERTRNDDVDPLRLNVNYLSLWPGYRKATVSSWDGAAGDLLLRLAKVLNWCYPSSGGKHGPDEIVAELRTLGAHARKLAGAKTGLDEGPVNWTDLVRRLWTVGNAFDGSPVSTGTVDLAAIASSVVVDAYGAIRFEAGNGKTVEREMTDVEQEVAGLLSGARDLLQTIIDRHADPGAGRFLRDKAGSIKELLTDESKSSDGRTCGTQATPNGNGSEKVDVVPDGDELQVLCILEDLGTLTKNNAIEKALREAKCKRSSSTVKAIVRRLLDKGWVVRPRQRSGVRLTEAGKAKLQP